MGLAIDLNERYTTHVCLEIDAYLFDDEKGRCVT
jgi:hypothetical protein